MTLTFTSPEWALKIRDEWKKNNAPCYLKKTSSPVNYSVCVRKGIDPIFVDLFIIENCMAPESRKGMRKELLKGYSPKEKERILSEFPKYNPFAKQNEG